MKRAVAVSSLVLCGALTWVFWPSAPTAEALAKSLERAYEAKLANPEYVEWKSLPGLPTTYQDFPEEREIKAIRSGLASMVSPEDGASPVTIPSHPKYRPKIDGHIDPSEWEMAVALPIGVGDSGTSLFMASDGAHLYLACDVPADTTNKGYDQLRFYFHVGLTPLIVNERIHVGVKTDDALGGIRQTNVRWKGAPPRNHEERWMKYPINDWQIYRNARGRASIRKHRQYEAVLDLEEAGLHPGVPFRAFVQVETDPAVDEDGRFDHRVYAGRYGTQDAPRWFLIEDTTPEGG